ncbi:cilia- and flagella-associated protein 221-like isoform X1 [Biomphalaria pfeifferi]|uniref:Cilia- and flagella-associated protein 221-like isoform X1 n=1 Tax=Biomphalaria pfeifferi TaxID=112525 RepID=A0AAD8FAZ1_BIOPF|nr:cilia- and flagella-associated protein 221-like isoform X1 [Biomphalaria pfeifferi]
MPTTLDLQDRTVDTIIASNLSNGTVSSGSRPNKSRHSSEVVVELSSSSTVINEKALLIENMILTEPDEERKKINVPNHLLDTKIYAKLGQNAFIQSKPSELLFEGFEVGKKQTRQLLLLNSSSDVLRLHIIPPQTDHFSIKYKKPERMVAGMILKCIVEFIPDEWRYYYDCIRIHCQGDENLIIPIHGYPVMNTKDFPRNYTFSPIPVGSSTSKTFPLKSLAAIDFEFCFKYIQRHPAFQIEPTSGIVPANSQTEITITFAPLEFQTALMKVELVISQLNFKGLISTFIGTSQPGLLRAKTLASTTNEVLDPKCFSPIERARSMKKTKDTMKSSKKPTSALNELSLEKNGIQFPQIIESPYAVAKVLLQKPGKLKVNEIRQNMQQQREGSVMTRQMKEALFDQLVRQNVYEERQNQLRWQVKLGDKPMTLAEKFKILEERSAADTYYRTRVQGLPIENEEFLRTNNVTMYRRTFRDVEMVADTIATFDSYSNDLWDARHAILDRFIQAARRVIIRNRCEKRLCGLRILKQSLSEVVQGEGETKTTKQNGVTEQELLGFKFNKIKKFTFPTYLSPHVKDDMAPDALGIVPVPATEIVIKRDVPFFNLKVPLYYQLYGYKPHNVHEAASGYVPTRNLRRLRTGAEVEEIRLPVESDPCAKFIEVKDDMKGLALDEKLEKKSAVVSLAPPESLFKPMDYPSLHIMNPAPGLQVFLPTIPYSEVDYDFHLCPLPRYPRTDRSVTQKKTLDREDTIRGLMTWKKFPSPGLSTLSNSISLSNIWVPRWDQCFSSDLLPTELPALMTRLESDDADNCVEEHDDKTGQVVLLTPEMVEAQFVLIEPKLKESTSTAQEEIFSLNSKLPSTNQPVGPDGPITRDQCEKELNFYMSQKFDKLSSQFRTRLDSMNALFTDSSYIVE